jgi:hypothetical protein
MSDPSNFGRETIDVGLFPVEDLLGDEEWE